MSANGRRHRPRPRIELLGGAATATEAAAIVAALERFLAERTPVRVAGPPASRWQRAALDEGVGGRAPGPAAWGRPSG